jgi:pimeloyl-ACP methyl ester carboxylesterase
VLGPLLRHTVSPLLGRLLWPLMLRRVFAPAPVTATFRLDYPVWLSLRPRTLHASASESALLAAHAARLAPRSKALEVPTVIVAGEKDRLVMTFWQSRRLHQRAPGSRLRIVPGAGHMVHHTHTAAVLAAVKEAFELSASHVRPVAIPPRVEGGVLRDGEPLADPVVAG